MTFLDKFDKLSENNDFEAGDKADVVETSSKTNSTKESEKKTIEEDKDDVPTERSGSEDKLEKGQKGATTRNDYLRLHLVSKVDPRIKESNIYHGRGPVT